jgi:cytoskeleton protein RodZ
MDGRMPPIGETLREARMRQKLDIADVEARTKIRAKYLRALENEEWGTLPGPTFVRTFLRTYAELVGLDPHVLVEEYRTNYESAEEIESLPRAGRPAATRRRRTPRGPPGKGPVFIALVVAFVGFLLVLGLVAGKDDNSSSDRAGNKATDTATTPRPRPKAKPTPPPAPRGVTVRVAPAEATYVCIDTGQGTPVVFQGTLEAPRTFKNAQRVRINLGKRAVDLRLNGKPVKIAPGSDPEGFDLTPKGAAEIPLGSRPCA